MTDLIKGNKPEYIVILDEHIKALTAKIEELKLFLDAREKALCQNKKTPCGESK